MKKLSEFCGEDALEVLADIIEPASEIMTDKELIALFRSRQMAKASALALRHHPKSILRIMARLDEADPATYSPSLIQLPKMLVELFNDPELVDLFTSQGRTTDQTNSGSATENSEVAVSG